MLNKWKDNLEGLVCCPDFVVLKSKTILIYMVMLQTTWYHFMKTNSKCSQSAPFAHAMEKNWVGGDVMLFFIVRKIEKKKMVKGGGGRPRQCPSGPL
jgi:hypothetical protein